MHIEYNNIFKELLSEYKIPGDLSFSVDLPEEIQYLLSEKILLTDRGIMLGSVDKLYPGTASWENRSVIEDNENHFHVEQYINPPDNKKAFELGITTLVLLAEKFQEEKLKNVRLWYSFHTPEIWTLFAKQNDLSEEDEEHYISDRLSFYTRRAGEEIISINEDEQTFEAILIIDL